MEFLGIQIVVETQQQRLVAVCLFREHRKQVKGRRLAFMRGVGQGQPFAVLVFQEEMIPGATERTKADERKRMAITQG